MKKLKKFLNKMGGCYYKPQPPFIKQKKRGKDYEKQILG